MLAAKHFQKHGSKFVKYLSESVNRFIFKTFKDGCSEVCKKTIKYYYHYWIFISVYSAIKENVINASLSSSQSLR